MKHSYLTLICLFATLILSAQEVLENKNINSANNENVRFRFQEFKQGTVYFKDGSKSAARLNYHLLVQQMQFIDPKGDTLALDNESTIKHIEIGDHLFYYHNKDFLELVEDLSTVKLLARKHVRVADRQKIGAYGQPSSTSSIDSYRSVYANDRAYQLSINEKVVLTGDIAFFILTNTGAIHAANKSNLIKAFPQHRSDIEKYVSQNPVNFKNGKDVTKLLQLVRTLNNIPPVKTT